MDTFRGIGAKRLGNPCCSGAGHFRGTYCYCRRSCSCYTCCSSSTTIILNVVKNMSMEMDNFASEILNIIERNLCEKIEFLMRPGRKRNGGSKLLAEINVTPLVDVVLVLLIIFMVTAPMLQMGIDVSLPRVKSKSIECDRGKTCADD